MPDGAPATRVQLLGPLRATVDGRQVDHRLPGRRGRALFALLVLNRDRALTRDEVIGHLWPHQAPSSPDGALSTLLTRLRQAIGPEHLEGRGLIALRLPDDALIDVEEVDRRVRAAREAVERGDATTALRQATEACALSADALLPEFDEPWVAERRRDAADAGATALELLARAALSLGGGELAAARTAARRLIEREPYRESGYALLMEAHARAGDDAEALRVFEQLRVLLRDELGTHPSATVTRLHQQVLEGALEVAAPAPAPPAPTPAPATPRVPLPPVLAALASARFVGRGAQLAALEGYWAEVTAGRPLLALVTGEPGIGKTALAAQFAGRIHARGATVLSGQCDEHSGVPFQPVAEALRRCARHAAQRWLQRERDPAMAAAGALVPELRHRLPEYAPPMPGEPDTDRYQLFEAARLMLERAGDGPVLLVLEDVHWADHSTLLMLRHIVREADDSCLMVLATCRDTEAPPGHPLHDAITDLDGLHALRRVGLRGLTAGESRALVEAGTGHAGTDVASRWHERTDGHPLFLRELLRAPAAAPGTAAEEVPAGVRELIAHRVRRLGEESRETLEVAAVAGRQFGVGLVAQLTGRSLDATIGALEEAIAHGLVDEVPGQLDRFSFHHELVRDALSSRQSRSRRVRLHARIGEALEQSAAAAAPAELAHHFFEARHVTGAEPALRYGVEAAVAASRALAYEAAAEHYRRALQTLAELEPERERERCELLLALGEEQRRAGDRDVEDTFRLAAESARARGDAHQLARAALAGRYAEAGLRDDPRVALLEEALAALGDEDSVLRVTVLARLGAALNLTGACDRAQQLTGEALAIARRLDDPEALIAALTGRHEALAHVDGVHERLALLGELHELGHHTGNPNVTAYAHQWSAFARLELGDFEAARVQHALFAGIAGDLRLAIYDHSMLAWMALFAQLDARLAEAERLAFEGYGLAERVPGTDAAGLLAAQLCFIRREQRRLPEILPSFESFVATADGSSWRSGLAVARAEAGELEGAREIVAATAAEDFADVAPDVWWLCTMALFGEACALVGDGEIAARLYRRLEPYADRHVQVAFTAHLGSVHRVLGLLAGAAGERARAVAHLEAALERHLSTGSRTLILRSQCDLAAMLASGPDERERARARELAHQALIGSRQTDLAGAVDAIAADVRRAADAPPAGTRPAPAPR